MVPSRGEREGMVRLSPSQVMDTEHAAEVHRGWPGCTCGVTAGSSDLPECGRGEGRAVFGGAEWYAAGGHTYTAAAKECVHQRGECVCGDGVCGECVCGGDVCGECGDGVCGECACVVMVCVVNVVMVCGECVVMVCGECVCGDGVCGDGVCGECVCGECVW